MTHISMLNSYNVLVEDVSIDKIVQSGISIFVHEPGEEPLLEAVRFMIFYFKEIEMYEKCNKLQLYIEKTFNEDGSLKEERCKCEYPEIKEYVPKIRCSVCNLRIK